MFTWYRNATVCLVFLFDLPAGDTTLKGAPSAFANCRWFTRGWTLQELIAPSNLLFLDSVWTERGTKQVSTAQIEAITGVDQAVLLDPAQLAAVPLARRMSWASTRNTTRIEDLAYCLMGLFDVNMPMIYGEGRKAFIRLQEEILKKTSDLSLFAWQTSEPSSSGYRGLLARSPAEFLDCGSIIANNDQFRFREEIALTNKGIRMRVPIHFVENELYIMDLDCSRPTDDNGGGAEERIGIWLVQRFDTYLRQFPGQFVGAEISPNSRRASIFLALDTDDQMTLPIPKHRDHRIYLLPPETTPGYKIADLRGVPSAFWHADGRFFGIGELTAFIGFTRFTVVTDRGKTTQIILVCELDGMNALRTSLYCEHGYNTSTKPEGFIDPFGDIERYGPVGDPFSLAVLSPGSVELNVLLLHPDKEDRSHSFLVSAVACRPDENSPGLFHIMLTVEAANAVGATDEEVLDRFWGKGTGEGIVGELGVLSKPVVGSKGLTKSWRNRLLRGLK
ncbi:hypothetical protein B0T25DRAFT_602828 [Lasiosphaeria hispida]|uniref:DUF8212 domain-containing protein n=1 Tax=Lasiosphaeria hispida TaxID=260671 RepID=A0AAJ0HKS2_9PEZI|nr:hypothetical protein B0T25DRAFT_602828 [Lasiosphaeria hispida]